MNYITQKFRKFTNKGLTLNGCLIDKNGVASNFLNKNYLDTSLSNTIIKEEYEFEIKVKFNSLKEYNLIFGAYANSNEAYWTNILFTTTVDKEGFVWRLSKGVNDTSQIRCSSYLVPELNKWYYLYCAHLNGIYYLKVFDENHNLIKDVQVTGRGTPTSAYDRPLRFGYLQSQQNLWDAEVDLSESWVKQNNKLISSWSI